jgi:putative autotransporter adhesin-like protein
MSSPRRALLLLAAAVAALALAGCEIGDDGPRTTQTRDVAGFTRIDNRDSVDVRLRVGEPQRVRVRAGEKVIDDVHTEVRDGTLEITFDDDGWGGDDVVVEASVPELTGIEASGSGDIDADGIDADTFEVRSHGSADIALAGTAGGSRSTWTARATPTSPASRRARRAWPWGARATCATTATRRDAHVDGSGDPTRAD